MTFEYTKYTLYEAVKRSADAVPENIAIYYNGSKVKYKTFIQKVDETADMLSTTLGVKKGDIILVAQPNIPEVLYLTYAINKLGAIVNFVHPLTPINRLKKIITETESKYAFVFEQRVAKELEDFKDIADKVIVTRVEDSLKGLTKFVYHFLNRKIRIKIALANKFNYFYQLKPKACVDAVTKFDKNAPAVLFHSGSTTGDPKTIMISNESLNYLASNSDYFFSCDNNFLHNKFMLTILPSFHGFGFAITMHTPLCNEFGAALLAKFTPKSTTKIINKLNVALMCGVPTMYESLLDYPKFYKNKNLRNMRACFTGGDSSPNNFIERFNECMVKNGSENRIFEGYGLTEAIAVNCMNNLVNSKPKSIGIEIPGATIKLFNKEGKECKPNEIGEICIKSPAVMVGYFKDSELTKKALMGGYLHTGDLGYKDEDGYIFFTSRKKRVVKVSGVAVFPNEVESFIESIDGVEKCCVIAVENKKTQHALKAFVVTKLEDKDSLKEHICLECKRNLIRWSIPREIDFVKEMPQTLLGKVDYKKLEE